MRCWGSNDGGESDVPSDLDSAVAIATGGYHTCALEAGGAVRCWGAEGFLVNYGESAVPSDLDSAVAIAAGGYHTCVLEVWRCRAVLGIQCGDVGQSDVPSDLDSAVAISAGYHHTCAL